MAVVLVFLGFGCGSSKSSDTLAAPTAPSPLAPHSGNPVVDQMLGDLTAEIASALITNQTLLPTNPGSVTQIQAKVTLLQRPTLASDIINGGFYVTASASSMSGAAITIAAVFPDASMRTAATSAAQELASALPVLERFTGRAFPYDAVRLWYGFAVGNSGGNGVINMEDQASYESRTIASRLPLEAILDHELSHSYIQHEGLNIFLEVYQYNVVHTNSTDPTLGTYARTVVAPPPDAIASSAAVLNVYRLIGHDAAANAYRAVLPLNPPYGQPLSDACKQAFIDQTPTDLKAQVKALMDSVVY